MGNHVYEAPNGVILSWQIHPAGYQVIFTSSSDEKSTDYFEPESYSNGEVYIERKDCIIIKKTCGQWKRLLFLQWGKTLYFGRVSDQILQDAFNVYENGKILEQHRVSGVL